MKKATELEPRNLSAAVRTRLDEMRAGWIKVYRGKRLLNCLMLNIAFP